MGGNTGTRSQGDIKIKKSNLKVKKIKLQTKHEGEKKQILIMEPNMEFC